MMKITNGNILLFFGIIHSLLGVSPFAFGKQFAGFADQFFFKISEGLFEFPLLNGQMNYENFAAFWFFYFGLLLIPLGLLVGHIEKTSGQLPKTFIWFYLAVVLVGVFMIPFSGMTFLMLPHATYMLMQSRQPNPQHALRVVVCLHGGNATSQRVLGEVANSVFSNTYKYW